MCDVIICKTSHKNCCIEFEYLYISICRDIIDLQWTDMLNQSMLTEINQFKLQTLIFFFEGNNASNMYA